MIVFTSTGVVMNIRIEDLNLFPPVQFQQIFGFIFFQNLVFLIQILVIYVFGIRFESFYLNLKYLSDLDSFIIPSIDSFHLYHTVQMLDLSLMFDCNGCLLSTQFPLCSGVTSSGRFREKWSASCIQMSSAEVTRQIPRTAASSSAPQLGHQYCDKTSLKRLRLRNLPDQFAFWVLLRASGSFWILTELFKWLVLSHFQDIAY